jgi:hypothetical protein
MWRGSLEVCVVAADNFAVEVEVEVFRFLSLFVQGVQRIRPRLSRPTADLYPGRKGNLIDIDRFECSIPRSGR